MTSKKEKSYLVEFGENTSFHGIRFVIGPNYHFVENALWLVAVSVAVAAACSIVFSSWSRYQDNPTVIAFEKNYRDWDFTFPALTLCFEQRLNNSLADSFIKQKWNLSKGDSDYSTIYNFLETVANTSYVNLQDFRQFLQEPKLKGITGEELLQMAHSLQSDVSPVRWLGGGFKMSDFELSLSEWGFCWAFNSAVARYLKPKVNKTMADVLKYDYFDPFTYNLETKESVVFFLHSPNDVPTLASTYYHLRKERIVDVAFRSVEMVSAPHIRSLTPVQRKCRFFDEPFPQDLIYNEDICKMNCRKQLSVEYCRCIPFFYPNWGLRRYKLCDIEGLTCIEKYVNNLSKFIGPGGHHPCKCPVLCDYISISVQTYVVKKALKIVSTRKMTEASLRIALQELSKIRQTRDVIFGFDDLLVSLGGTVSFFTGCSVLSFVELIYIWTLRYFWMKWRLGDLNSKIANQGRLNRDVQSVSTNPFSPSRKP